MKTFNILFSIALFMSISSFSEGKNSSTCNTKSIELEQQLKKLDCQNTISEAAKFLSNGYSLVLGIASDKKRNLNEISSLKNGLQSRQKTMLNCFTKHRNQNEFSDAMIAIMKADSALEKLSETTDLPRQVKGILLREFKEAVETVSNLKTK